MIALHIAQSGYYGGDPGKVLEARVDHVLAVKDFEAFTHDYQNAEWELNRDD